MLERAPSAPPRKAEYGHAVHRLAARRRLRRRRGIIAFSTLLLLMLAAALWGLQQSSVRISRIDVYGPDLSLAEYAKNEMQGNYFGLIPRDSTFFFPASAIRVDIIAAHPDIAAVSIFRNGLTGLSIKVSDRVPIARWCIATSTNCYLFDASGFVYATTSSAQPVNSFVVYEPIAGGNDPMGGTLPNAEKMPSAFDFARQLATLGSPVTKVVVRDDEVDDYLASGTRITYVLGHENDAFTALVSTRDSLNLADGSIEYIDLRFDGKVYLKRNK